VQRARVLLQQHHRAAPEDDALAPRRERLDLRLELAAPRLVGQELLRGQAGRCPPRHGDRGDPRQQSAARGDALIARARLLIGVLDETGNEWTTEQRHAEALRERRSDPAAAGAVGG
jgi:hypothetical protein